jgi:tRNA splicing ligase
VLVDKENGECAHVGAFTHNDTRYWIAGSKNVHVIFKVGDFATAESVYTADRYRYAIKIARVWNAQSASIVDTFHDYLTETGYTACGEAILSDSEHIVAYDEKDLIKFYALSKPGSSTDGLTAVCPIITQTIFASFELPTAVFSPVYEFNSSEYVNALENVARRRNSEGVVAYGLDDNCRVVCMWKEKSYPYVMERVVREQITHNKTQKQIRNRVKQRLSEHEGALRTYFAEWEAERFPWLLSFAAWLKIKGITPVKNAWDVQSKWLTLQHEFHNAPTQEKKEAETVRDTALTENGIKVIQFVGLPGSGKSTAARGIYWLLKQAGHSPRWLNQDEADSNRKKYLDAIKNAMMDSSTSHILLDKSNLDPMNRKDYEDLGLDVTMTVHYTHPDGFDAYKAVCLERFLARGQGHRSLPASVGEERFTEICADMFAKYQKPSGNVLDVDVRDPPASVLAALSSSLGLVTVDCLKAVEFAQAYEEAIKANPKKPTFCGIEVREGFETLLSAVPAEALVGKELRKDYHITTRYFGGEMDPVYFMTHKALMAGETPSFRITEIVWDDKIVTARVQGDFACANKIPHITIAMAPKTQASYSNTVLESHVCEKLFVNIPLCGKYYFG